MLLTLDIGNTNIKSAILEDSRLNEFTIHPDSDKLFNYLSKSKFTKAVFCSVNPSIEKILVDYFSAKQISVFRANIQNKFNLTIKYDTPNSLGMDRVCSAVGALDIAAKEKLLSKNQYLITIDFGTATTINIVSPSQEFIGGLIAPGISTMLKSLNERTAQLPLPDLSSYSGIIGRSTDTSIISGVVTSTIGMINETVNHLSEMSHKIRPQIFITGGNAEYTLPHLKHKVIFEEALVLKGVKVIYDLNK
jgi:type III pantothenate kinase